MPARFLPPPDFPRLSEKARELASEPPPDPLPDGWVSGFELEAMSAEMLHGIAALPPEADNDPRALMVVAEQINFRLAAGEDLGTKGSEQRGTQALVVARDPRTGVAIYLSPVAKALAAELIAEYEATTNAPTPTPPAALPGYSHIWFSW